MSGNWDTDELNANIADAILLTGVFLFVSSCVNVIKVVSRGSPYPQPELKEVAKSKSAYDYLNEAIGRQGFNEVPEGKFMETWIEGNCQIQVRVHPGNPQYTSAKQIFRVARRAYPLNGMGWEYLGSNGIWYPLSCLMPKSIYYNSYAAMITHIPVL